MGSDSSCGSFGFKSKKRINQESRNIDGVEQPTVVQMHYAPQMPQPANMPQQQPHIVTHKIEQYGYDKKDYGLFEGRSKDTGNFEHSHHDFGNKI